MAELIHVHGLRELNTTLKGLGPKLARTGLRRAVGAGAAVVRKAVKAAAPVGQYERPRKGRTPGTLKRAVTSAWARERSNSVQQSYVVTVRKGKKQQAKGRDAFYWPWVEFGHKVVPRRGKAGGSLYRRRISATYADNKRTVAPRPFLRPAFNASRYAALDAIQTRLRAEIEKLGK